MRLSVNSFICKREEEFFEKIEGKRLVCYGASSRYEELNNSIYIEDLLDFFVDGDSARWGKVYFGKEIKNPEIIRSLDKEKYAVVVLAAAFEEIAVILDDMGLKREVDYFNIFELLHIRESLTNHINAANKLLRFLDTVPQEIKEMVPNKDKKIGIIASVEGIGISPEFPYSIVLFLILKWKGYHVQLVIDNLYWTNDIIWYAGACEDCETIMNEIIHNLSKLVSEDDIVYLNACGNGVVSEEDKKECRRVAQYSAEWMKGKNIRNPRYMSEKTLQEQFEAVFNENIGYVNAFFDKHHYDTVNVSTALHQRAGIIRHVCDKRGIRVSSQDGAQGAMQLSADGPASYGKDISRVVQEKWLTAEEERTVLSKANRMAEMRFAQYSLGEKEFDLEQYWEAVKSRGLANVSLQSPRKESDCQYDVIIPLNIPNDGAALGVGMFFDTIRQWLIETLDFLINKEGVTVLLRDHPGLNVMPSFYKASDAASIVPDVLESYKGNKLLHYAKYDEDMNLYQYIEKCKVVLPWTSTVGVEAAIMKKNVVTHTNVYYQDSAFVMKAHSRDEYFSLIHNCIVNDGWLVENETAAYQEALEYFYFGMNRSIHTKFVIYNRDFRCVQHEWLSMSFDELIKEAGIDEIVQIVAENIPSVYLSEQQCS